MTTSARKGPTTLDLSREGSWVAHAALVRSGREATEAGEARPIECRLLEKLEDDDPFKAAELSALRDALVVYLGDAPLRDRAPGREALRAVTAAIDPADPTSTAP
ncbi:hypothetical protein [Halopenitus sp. POP-27]|uniref:DUF7853 family protein n=1 Tax=Halopenitus sp. POP-27 TaxID=2994425 RepID=UPI002468CAF6|nr:hypothetical protein [Halopenitus sp. POP-27]